MAELIKIHHLIKKKEKQAYFMVLLVGSVHDNVHDSTWEIINYIIVFMYLTFICALYKQ